MRTITRHLRVSIVVAALIATGIFLPRVLSSRESVREIRVVARDMAYHVETLSDRNPTLQLTAGEQVRVTFRNEDRGMLHDFGIPLLGVGTGTVAFGTEKTLTFKAPASSGDLTYVCTPHSAMMSGRIVIAK
jgi:plastocyanin